MNSTSRLVWLAVVFASAWAPEAAADTVSVSFAIPNADLAPCTVTNIGDTICLGTESIGSLTLTLNPDGSVSGDLTSTVGGIFLFGMNESLVGSGLLTLTGLPAGYIAIGSLSSTGFADGFDIGFENDAAQGQFCTAPADCVTNLDFTVSSPTPFTSASQFAEFGVPTGQGGTAAEFLLWTAVVEDNTLTELGQAGAEVVPEPKTYSLTLIGLGLLGLARKLRSRHT